jgi:hypothetical protein
VAAWIAGSFQPPLESMCDAFRLMIGQAAGDDEEAGVGLAGLKEGEGQTDEIVPVPGDEDSVLGSRIPELVFVFQAAPADIMDRDDIHSEAPGRCGDFGAEILIEEKVHSSKVSAVPGTKEGKFSSHSLRSPLFLALQPCVDLSRIELIIGKSGTKLGLGEP